MKINIDLGNLDPSVLGLLFVLFAAGVILMLVAQERRRRR
jgi:hypothetical protein